MLIHITGIKTTHTKEVYHRLISLTSEPMNPAFLGMTLHLPIMRMEYDDKTGLYSFIMRHKLPDEDMGFNTHFADMGLEQGNQAIVDYAK